MIETAQLAGYFAAHSVLCVSEGETLVPIHAWNLPDGGGSMDRYLLDDLRESGLAAREALRANEAGAVRGVVVVDSFVHGETGSVDALFIEAVEYGLTPATLQMVVPYVPKTESTEFVVYPAEFFDENGFDPDYAALSDAFFAGVASHEEGAAVWNAHSAEPA